jgi:hypothetical protein
MRAVAMRFPEDIISPKLASASAMSSVQPESE